MALPPISARLFMVPPVRWNTPSPSLSLSLAFAKSVASRECSAGSVRVCACEWDKERGKPAQTCHSARARLISLARLSLSSSRQPSTTTAWNRAADSSVGARDQQWRQRQPIKSFSSIDDQCHRSRPGGLTHQRAVNFALANKDKFSFLRTRVPLIEFTSIKTREFL